MTLKTIIFDLDGTLLPMNQETFAEDAEMTALLSKLMEPGQYPNYLRLNKKFYSHFCNL